MKSIQYIERNRIVEAFNFSCEFKEDWPSWFLDLIIQGRVTFDEHKNICRIKDEHLNELLVKGNDYIVKYNTKLLVYGHDTFYQKYELLKHD